MSDREKLIRDALEKVREIGEAGLAGEPLHSIPKDIDSNWGRLQSQWPVVVAVDTVLAAQSVLDPVKVAEVERAAAARALDLAADQWRYHWGSNGEETELWLRARAAEIRGQHGND